MSGTGRNGSPQLPRVHEMGLSVAELDLHGGALFWAEVEALVAAAPLDDLVAELLGRGGTPRIWLFLDEAGETSTRAAAALAAARALTGRRHSVIVIDGDDRRPDLSRWAGRVELEGWIDFVRYGASLGTCSVPLPWDPELGRLLGVGSFWPVDASEDEVNWLLTLLASHAEFLLVTAPLDSRAVAWLESASLPLLCWDRAARPAADTAAIVARLASLGRPAAAIVGFGPDGSETPPSTAPALAEAARSMERFKAAVAASATVATSAAGGLGEPAAAGPSGDPDLGASLTAECGRGRALPSSPPAAGRRSDSSKRTGRRAAGAALLALGILAIYLLAGPRRQRDDVSTLAPAQVVGDISPPAGGAGEAADTVAAVADSERPGKATADSLAAGAPAPTGVATGESPGDALFDQAPFQLPVGSGGWALHVYSQPDSALAERQVRELLARGFRCEWRCVELPGKGRWYRIYMGGFSSREAARAALPALLRRLGEDWGQVVRY